MCLLPYANNSIKIDRHFRWNNSSKVKVLTFVGHLMGNLDAKASVGKMARLTSNYRLNVTFQSLSSLC